MLLQSHAAAISRDMEPGSLGEAMVLGEPGIHAGDRGGVCIRFIRALSHTADIKRLSETYFEQALPPA